MLQYFCKPINHTICAPVFSCFLDVTLRQVDDKFLPLDSAAQPLNYVERQHSAILTTDRAEDAAPKESSTPIFDRSSKQAKKKAEHTMNHWKDPKILS